MKKWCTEFRCGCTSINNTDSFRRPVEVATPETTERVHDKAFADQRLRMRKIVNGIDILLSSLVPTYNHL